MNYLTSCVVLILTLVCISTSTAGTVLKYTEQLRNLYIQISGGWWRQFLERNPSMSLRAGDATVGVGMDAINEENMRNYIDLLEDVSIEQTFQKGSIIWTRLVCP